MPNSADHLRFYATQGLISDPCEHADLLVGLPSDIPSLVEVVQGVLLHVYHAGLVDVEITETRRQETELRQVQRILGHIRQLHDAPLTVCREPAQRLIAGSRDFSVLLASLLRHQGIPARARCGFASYFQFGRFEDHWLCEWWDRSQERWIRVDSQIDAIQRDIYSILFNAFDVPMDRFLCAGRAWQMCRKGFADPNLFGIFNLQGMWFIRGNLIRDLAALNKMELLPWDAWGLIETDEQALTGQDLDRLDLVAMLTTGKPTATLDCIRSAYMEPGFCVPPTITSFGRNGTHKITLHS